MNIEDETKVLPLGAYFLGASNYYVFVFIIKTSNRV